MELKKIFICGKKSEICCEDGYVFCDDFAAVVDGVTSKSEKLFRGKTPGKIGMEVVCREIPLLEKDISFKEAAKKLSLALIKERQLMAAEQELTRLDYPRACAAIYSKHRREIWLIGDCQCMVNGKLFTNTKEIDGLLACLRSFVLECEKIHGKTEADFESEDPGRLAILPFLKNQLEFENKEGAFGYPVLNGEDVPAEKILVIPVPEGSLVTLATDGYPKLYESLEECESALEEILAGDPLCYKDNVQTKGLLKGNDSFDDRCFLQFTTYIRQPHKQTTTSTGGTICSD